MGPSSLVITFPPTPAYNISQPELITVTVPASVVSSGRSYPAFPSFLVLPTRGSAAIGMASTLRSATESDLRGNESTLVISLQVPPTPLHPPSPRS